MITSSDTLQTSQTNPVISTLEKNYSNNLESNYTEKIEELDQNFNYSSNSNAYWSEPEHSLLYGTPLYEQASLSQKLALNHLHWVLFYKLTADSETELIHYNTVTADCLMSVNSDYKMLVDLLGHETDQERKHIHTFYKVNYQTTKFLLGKKALINSASDQVSLVKQKSFQFSDYLSSAANFITMMMLKDKEQSHSENLREVKDVNKPASFASNGFFNGLSGKSNPSRRQFFSDNWRTYPFLAANFYAVRYMANLALKNHEFGIHKYYKKLQKDNQFIPSPTTISHYHFLDEAFHTTTSLFLGRDFYKTLPKPSLYEKLIANLAILQAQHENLNAISGISSNRFLNDNDAIVFLMKLLQSPVFDMSAPEAIDWIEKCLCHEHEGFHINLKVHNQLLSSLRKFAEQLDYLWPVNREMRVMASGGSIKKAIKNNIRAFKQFSRAV
uniref:NocO n=1 Tax=Nostoc sp. CCAP 1453/38 TaxID=1570104 RepID=A0A186QIJ8_9NOSO|nr:NocO [Nostoc sp. CCAP 1453/38]